MSIALNHEPTTALQRAAVGPIPTAGQHYVNWWHNLWDAIRADTDARIDRWRADDFLTDEQVDQRLSVYRDSAVACLTEAMSRRP